MKALFSMIACSLLSTLLADPYSCQDALERCPKAPKWCGVTYEVYGEYLFLQPNSSNLNYAVEAIGLDPDIAVPAVSPNWKVKEIDPHYHSGFEVGTAFLFRNTNMGIRLNWERLHAHDKDSFTASSAAGYMVGPFFDIGPNSSSYKVAKGKVRSHFDGVNLNYEKAICFFNRLNVTIGGGVGFARIKQTLRSSYSNVADTISRSMKASSKFIGAGPQLVLGYDCRLFSNVFFTGSTDISLFMGQMKNSTTFQSFTPELAALGIPQPNNQKTSVPNRAQLVPGFEQKLGFSYVASWDSVQVAFEIGYQCQIYINAVQTVDMTAPQVLPAGAIFTPQVGVFAVGFERTLSNYMLTGPYASVDFKF